ncbi:hypothetical protein [uncultured Aquincola sp.]|uniref:hypothetical protein n=1 Tax=uncultured Aquincola sp. TaxID=886556 RepID=UPI0032B1DD95
MLYKAFGLQGAMVTSSVLYKGAGPGSHWHVHDARLTGFSPSATAPPTPAGVVRHIAQGSLVSPYISFTTSFAVARQYALVGVGGVASSASPGYVYEVDVSQMGVPFTFVNPLERLIAGSNGRYCHEHNGTGALLAEIAAGMLSWSAAMQSGMQYVTPTVTPELRALVFAVRDAEVLSDRSVPAAAIFRRHNVS